MKNFPPRKRAMNYYFRKPPTTNPRIAHVVGHDLQMYHEHAQVLAYWTSHRSLHVLHAQHAGSIIYTLFRSGGKCDNLRRVNGKPEILLN